MKDRKLIDEFILVNKLDEIDEPFLTARELVKLIEASPEGMDFVPMLCWSFNKSEKSGYVLSVVFNTPLHDSGMCVNLKTSRGQAKVFKTFEAAERFCLETLKVDEVRVLFG